MKKRDLVAAGAAAILATFGLAQAGATGTSAIAPTEQAAPAQTAPAQVASADAQGAPEPRRAVRVVYPNPYQR